ncbi:WD40-repeat-containing domain protein [Chytriomyces sp. MP71]|nr:WD40-repeat-containing domain protein [Chytriomyces sp. MP71]
MDAKASTNQLNVASSPMKRNKSSAQLTPGAALTRTKSPVKSPSNANLLRATPSTAQLQTSSLGTGPSVTPDRPPFEKPPVGEALAMGKKEIDLPAEGIIPLFLAGMTQDIFKIKGGEDVTIDKPCKIIPKADILADIQTRRAVSDFQPFKDRIMEYPDDELLVYYDAEFKYGQNFVLVISREVVEHILRPPTVDPEVAEEATLGYTKKKKPVSKPWECLGSDKDIELEQVLNTRDLIHVKISRPRRDFGKPCDFSDREGTSDAALDCKSYKDPAYEVNRMELGIGIQAIPNVATTAQQTTWFRPVNLSTQYEPQILSEMDQKKLLDADELIDYVKAVADSFDHVLEQNALLDIFVDDFRELGEEDVHFEKGAHSFLQEYQSFTDLEHSKDKSISCTDWHPSVRGIVAVSCVQRVTFDERVEAGFVVRSKQSLILIWSFHDPIHPQLILEAPEDVNCFQFNPTDPNFIAGGCVNGQIVLWDVSEYQDKLKSTRKARGDDDATAGAGVGTVGEVAGTGAGNADEPVIPIVKYIVASSIEFCHRGGVSDLQWLPSNMLVDSKGEVNENPESGNRQLVTCSLDGQVYIWDTRSKKDLKALDLTWKPFLRVPLSSMDNTFDYGLTKVSLKSLEKGTEGSGPKSPDKNGDDNGEKKKDKKDKESNLVSISKFFTATEEGDLIFSDWVAEKSSEEKASRVEHAFSWHFAPMSDLQRSPFFPDILLSSGGWSFQIWKERVNTGPLVSSPNSPSYIISGRWSPTRPGVFFISKADGTIEVWDLLDSTYQPATVQNVASVGISHMTIRQYPGKGATQFVAAADDEGTLHILEVPRHLSKPSKNEKVVTRIFFDREVKRIAYAFERKQVRVRERGVWEQAKLEAVQVCKAPLKLS